MCEALKILMKPEIEEGRLEGRLEGKQEGRLEGRLILLNEQITSGILTKEAAAKCINMTVAELEAKLAELSATLVEN